MSEDVQNYIDKKFDKLTGVIMKFVGILVTVLVLMIGAISYNMKMAISNTKDVNRHDLALKEMVTKQQMDRLIEFSKLRKEVVMAVLSGENVNEKVDELWEKLDQLESAIVRDDYNMYTRGKTK